MKERDPPLALLLFFALSSQLFQYQACFNLLKEQEMKAPISQANNTQTVIAARPKLSV